MTEPKRWLNEPSALSAAERRALEAALRDRPNAAQKRAVWAAVAAGLPAHAALAKAVVGKTLSATAAPTTAVSAAGMVPMLIKPLLFGFALAGLTVGGVSLMAPGRTPSPPAVVSKHAAARDSNSKMGANRTATEALSLPSAQPGELPETPSPPARFDLPRSGDAAQIEDPTRSVDPAQSNSSRTGAGQVAVGQVASGARNLGPKLAEAPNDAEPLVSALQEESRSLAKARQTLNTGALQSALDQLNAIESNYPNGVLNEEREVLILETLSRMGKKQAARQRAQRFIERFPKSPHLRAAQSFLD